MKTLITSRKVEMAQGGAQSRHDLFSLMLGTSEEEGSSAMTDEELVSGHHTRDKYTAQPHHISPATPSSCFLLVTVS